MGSHPGSLSKRLAILLLFLWFVAFTILYYVYHKPVEIEEIGRIFSSIWNLTIATVIFIAAGAFGRRFMTLRLEGALTNPTVQAALGLGIFSLVLLAIAWLGFLQRWIIVALLIVVITMLRRDAGDWLKSLGEFRTLLDRHDRFSISLAGFSLIIVLANLVVAAAPPAQFDALVYHLQLPTRFLAEGSLFTSIENPFWGFPLGGEMLFAATLALAGMPASAILAWMIGVLTLLGLLGFCATFNKRAGWVAVAALLSGQTISDLLGWAYVEWYVALMALSAVLLILAGTQREDWRPFILAGALAGFAWGAKYVAAGLGLAGIAMILYSLRGRRGWFASAIFAAVMLAVVSPWFVRNLIATGAPLYPALGQNLYVNEFRQSNYRAPDESIGTLNTLITPLAASLTGIEGAPGFAADLGPLLMGLAPAALLVIAQWKSTKSLIVFVLVGWLIWIVARNVSDLLGQSRLYFAYFPAWAALAGSGYIGLSRYRISSIRLGRISAALILFVLGLTALSTVVEVIKVRALPAALGLISEEDYLTARLGAYYPTAKEIQRNYQPSSVVMLWEPRGLFCEPACLPDYWLDRFLALQAAELSQQDIFYTLRAEGVTHILLNMDGLRFVRQNDPEYSESDWRALDRLLQSAVLETNYFDAYELYRIAP